jgi:hypothetical protein
MQLFEQTGEHVIDQDGTKLQVIDEVRVEFMRDRKRKTVISARDEFFLVETRGLIHGCSSDELTFVRRL